MSIKITDILQFDNLKNVKIRFNQQNNFDFDPIKFFKEDKQRLLNGHFHNYSKKSYKQGNIVVGFAKIEGDRWLLFDVSLITKDLNKYNAVGYEHKTLLEYEKFCGRLVIKFHNRATNLIRIAENVIDECEVVQILEDTFDNDIFPGYENVNISWQDLSRVIEKETWKTALKNQKGVYLITDISIGQMYVGKASGKDMILGRWQSYIKSGHGGNTELKKRSFDYIKENFKFSILDIYKSTIDDKIILDRETWWKNNLLTKEFGYNKN